MSNAILRRFRVRSSFGSPLSGLTAKCSQHTSPREKCFLRTLIFFKIVPFFLFRGALFKKK